MDSGRYLPKRGVAPFGDPRIKACSRLPGAYRSVPRPSSPLGAKASTRCPSFPRPPQRQPRRPESATSGNRRRPRTPGKRQPRKTAYPCRAPATRAPKDRRPTTGRGGTPLPAPPAAQRTEGQEAALPAPAHDAKAPCHPRPRTGTSSPPHDVQRHDPPSPGGGGTGPRSHGRPATGPAHRAARTGRGPGLVGLGRLERPTSRLSGVRSNQLSYRPGAGQAAGTPVAGRRRAAPVPGCVEGRGRARTAAGPGPPPGAEPRARAVLGRSLERR